MVDKKPTDSPEIIKNTFSAFVNLLKEFPRSASEDFIYDASTLKKIEKADQILKDFIKFNKAQSKAFPAEDRKAVKECQAVLSGLMEEMPLSPEDEFLYDSEIHRQVESAREAIIKLGNLFP